jgi:hypothetical protein
MGKPRRRNKRTYYQSHMEEITVNCIDMMLLSGVTSRRSALKRPHVDEQACSMTQVVPEKRPSSPCVPDSSTSMSVDGPRSAKSRRVEVSSQDNEGNKHEVEVEEEEKKPEVNPRRPRRVVEMNGTWTSFLENVWEEEDCETLWKPWSPKLCSHELIPCCRHQSRNLCSRSRDSWDLIMLQGGKAGRAPNLTQSDGALRSSRT